MCTYKVGEVVLTCTYNVLSKNIENIKILPSKFSNFTAEKILCIFHGQVFVMGFRWGLN